MNITLAKLIQTTVGVVAATAATFVIVVGSAGPAAATEMPPTIAVETAGIDLASPAGEARIATAVARAARRVCTTGDDRGVAASRDRRACIATAMATAMPQVAQLAEAARTARPQLADISEPTGPVSR